MFPLSKSNWTIDSKICMDSSLVQLKGLCSFQGWNLNLEAVVVNQRTIKGPFNGRETYHPDPEKNKCQECGKSRGSVSLASDKTRQRPTTKQQLKPVAVKGLAKHH